MEFEKAVEVQEGRKRKTIFADIVVYASSKKTSPLLLCEAKGPNEVLDRSVKEQAISYARLLPKIAPIAVITNGSQVQVFQTLDKNRIAELPHRRDLHTDIVNFIVSKETQDALRAEAKHELFIIDDVQSFKNILKACHNEIRNNEGYDPTQAFDEMSKVLFCKLYEERINPAKNRFRTAIFDEMMDRAGINVVAQIFTETKKHSQYAGLFSADSAVNLQDRTVRKIVSLFENYDLSLTAFDVKGEAYEYFLGDTFTGGLGEFFTPRNVVEFIVDALGPRIGEKIVDPFCGTGGFLIYAFEVVSEKIRLNDFSKAERERWKEELSNRSLYGTDWKERTSIACKMNMTVHGDGSSGIFLHHGLTDVEGVIEEGTFDICLTNPPFGSFENDPEILRAYELTLSRNSQDRVVLAIERAIRLVKPGSGRIGIVVIDGILNNKSGKPVREYIKRHARLLGVVSLARETFEGYGARAKTSVLFLERKQVPDDGEQGLVFFGVASNTGYAPNGNAVPGNELPDLLVAYRDYLRGNHPELGNLRIARPGDRLDAEFYVPQAVQATADAAVLYDTASTTLTDLAAQFAAVRGILDTALAAGTFGPVRLGDVLSEVRTPVKLQGDVNYPLLGVRWWGGGAFIREEKLGKDIKASTAFAVGPNIIVYNRLFAFRGSFALSTGEHEGAVASGEFPMFDVKDGAALNGVDPLLLKKYLVYCLNSPQYRAVVDRLSTGSTKTSRNRLLQDTFLGITVAVPTDSGQLAIFVDLFERLAALAITQQQLIQDLESFREGAALQLLLAPNLLSSK